MRAFGLFRSGTTWLQALIDANLKAGPVPDGYLYKHAHYPHQLAKMAPADIVVTYKTLPKWIDSLCRNSFDLIDEYDLAFRRGDTPIEIVYKEENHPEHEPIYVGVSLERLIDLYHEHWDVWHGRAMIVSHKKMAIDPEAGIATIGKKFGVPVGPYVPVTTVQNSGPFSLDDYDDLPFLSTRHRDTIDRNCRPEIQEFLLA